MRTLLSIFCLLYGVVPQQYASAFVARTPARSQQQQHAFFVSTRTSSSTLRLEMAVVPPSSSSVVGVVGRGYISVLTAKLSALAGYSTWMLVPPGEEETIQELLGSDELLDGNLELIDSSDAEKWQLDKLPNTDALLFAVDADVPLDEGTVRYMVNKEAAPKLKRVVTMSRNLNGQDMGFLVKVSKNTANKEVWDGSTASAYKSFETAIQKAVQEECSDETEYTIVRAGTLKGGACGDEKSDAHYPQFLSKKFYEMTKKDIVTWQLLFDCNARGVELQKGDVMPGPGGKAIFYATATDGVAGESSRCGIADAMVRSLAVEAAGNVDFGIGTKPGREPPTDSEWEEMFSVL